MPHSSGGGSHGGGSHGGGGGGTRVSHSYFPGARRYRRHNPYTGYDEYIYANAKPQKTGIGTVLIVFLFGAFFLGGAGMSLFQTMPRKLEPEYTDRPAVYDSIDVIEDDAVLLASLNEYYELTGICTDIYTVSSDEWAGWGDLEDYTYDWYVRNFSDEQHWVFVISYTASDAERINQGEKFVAQSFAWEAVQGNYTDPIITESMFKKFAQNVMDYHYSGEKTGNTFNTAFRYAINDAHDKLDGGSKRTGAIASSLIPILLILLIFVPIIIAVIKQYKKDKDTVIEEVGFTEEDLRREPNISNRSGSQSQVSSSLGKTAVGVGSVISLVVIGLFMLVGIGMIIGGIAELSQDVTGGVIMIGFGVIWTAILAIGTSGTIKQLIEAKKKRDEVGSTFLSSFNNANVPVSDPVPARPSPARDVSEEDYTKINPFATAKPQNSETQGVQVQPDFSTVKPEFDPKYFASSGQKYDDDEDFERKKRQGYE